ncbi:MAG: hypothetical protein DMG32_00740 [Acidobacteria bacterium]|nr:MAG: hypothetical protein DMG32_00740 [Acidobacteriota bacterium]
MNRTTEQVPLSPGSLAATVPTAFSEDSATSTNESLPQRKEAHRAGLLIVNADDWGRDPYTTDRILDCSARGVVSSVSAMVFMEDSERAAAMAVQLGIDAGLHLNFTTEFSSPHCPARLIEHQRKLARYLSRHPFARAVFHPGLVRSFEYVVAAQIDEFCRLYKKSPARLDGHHHMHLCTNVLFGSFLPKGTIVRRHFSYERGEKTVRNRIFRKFTSVMLLRRHRIVDFFFSLPPLEPANRLQWIFSLARQSVVEIETHPVNPDEYRFLMEGEILRLTIGLPITSGFVAPF